MEIEEGIEHILNGNALLFCGSGFSYGAISRANQPFLIGDGLIKLLCNQIDIEENDLEYVSQKYSKKFGDESLLKLLINNYTAKKIQEYHSTIANLPWRRIYTTNYDDVIEKAGTEILRKPVTLNNAPEDFSKHDELVIHLNGSISKVTICSDSLLGEIKLTKTSYLSRNFVNSKWHSRLLNDLKSVNVIFFIGFSLDYDLEIQQVIAHANQKDKIFFVNGSNISDKNRDILSDYGKILQITGEEFANKILKKQSTFMPTIYDKSLYSIKKYICNKDYEVLKDISITNLLFYGEFREQLYINNIDSYVFKRTALEKVMDSINRGKKFIIIHAELGNGKTIFLNILKIRLFLENNHKLYVVNTIDEKIYNDLTVIIEKSTDKIKSIIFIDNYNNYFKILKLLNSMNTDNLIFVLTARSYIHEISFTELKSLHYFDDSNIVEFNLNNLDENEINSLYNYFEKHNYLWGRNSNLSKGKKKNHLKNICKSNLKSIIISTYENSTIKNKILKLIEKICENSENQELLFLIIISNILNLNLDVDEILSILDLNGESYRIAKNENMRELFDISNSLIKIKSSVLSNFILEHNNKKTEIVDLMVKIMRKLDFYSSTEKMKNIQYMLISQSSFEMIVIKQKYKEEYESNIIKYY